MKPVHNVKAPVSTNLPFKVYSSKFIVGLKAKNYSAETTCGYEVDLKMLNQFLEEHYNGVVMLTDITTQNIEDYLTMLRKERNYQPASVNRHLCTMRSFYNFAVKRGWTTIHAAMPIDQLKVPIKERAYIDAEEFAELVNAIEHPTIKVIIQFLFFTGLRINECLNLSINDVDIDNKMIHVRHGKGDKERKVPLSSKLVPILTEYKENIRPIVESNRFFALNKTGKVSAVYVNRILHETTAKLKWEKVISCHILRHSFASNLVKNDINVVYIQKLLGHTDLKTTSRYVHANQNQLTEAISVL